MKKFLFALLAFMPLVADAQVIMGGNLPPLELIKKTVYDSARVKVYYDYAYRPDSTNTDKWKKGQVLLLVGSRYTGCYDYYSMRTDSLNDAWCREKRPSLEAANAMLQVLKNRKYEYPLVIDNTKNKVTARFDKLKTVQYTQTLEPLAWTLAAGDSTIAGVRCKKATCRMGGRDWVAWYSEEYNMPFGPYLFRGLPGLIFAVSDTGNNYVFTLNGLETDAVPAPIYLHKDNDVLKLSREKAWRAYRNAVENPVAALTMTNPSIILPEGTTNDKRPYNPIELE
ncbi:GLPGLI family protein [Marseilla massiliensis]|uniref:GLPGLI family protein n=1 Tax=Marseilla massiliensis TaxID=1841864 RepID=A0A938WV08_9BACT|nr:GLPGLI family protein [Marseilla massiliensis]MBM6674669.1 GLPGLI family protein [Marseilla massiliensis]